MDDATREYDMVYQDLDKKADDSHRWMKSEMQTTCKAKPYSELLDGYVKTVQKPITLTSVAKKKLAIPAQSCLPGCVDLCGKALPALIELETKSQSFEIFVAFNRCPTRQNHDLKFISNSALIPEKHSHKITNDFSIRFLIISSEMVFCNAFVRLSNKKGKVAEPLQHENSIVKGSFIDDIRDLDLRSNTSKISITPAKMFPSLIEHNVNAVYQCRKDVLVNKYKRSVVEVDSKIKSARLRKELAIEVKRSQLLQSLKKHESTQARANRKISETIGALVDRTSARVWLQGILTYRIMYGMIKLIEVSKRMANQEQRVVRQTSIIQRKLRPILGWLIRDKNKSTLERAGYSIRVHIGVMADTIHARARTNAGAAMNQFFKVINIRNLMFNRVAYYIKIQNRWKNWMRNKQRAKLRFDKQLEYAYCKLLKMPDFLNKSLSRVGYHFSQRCKDDIFDLFFNDQLLRFIKNKLEYMANRGTLLDVGLYFQQIQDIAHDGGNKIDYEELRKSRTKEKLLQGIAIALYKAWLVCKSPSKVRKHGDMLKTRMFNLDTRENPVPMSLVKIRDFPTFTNFIQTHRRSELYQLIKTNYRLKKYEAAAYRLGDLDAISVMSPRKFKYVKPAEEPVDERKQIEVIRKAAQTSVGIRRIMNLLNRDYTEKLDLEFSNEFLVTVILSAFEFYALKYASSLKSLTILSS